MNGRIPETKFTNYGPLNIFMDNGLVYLQTIGGVRNYMWVSPQLNSLCIPRENIKSVIIKYFVFSELSFPEVSSAIFTRAQCGRLLSLP